VRKLETGQINVVQILQEVTLLTPVTASSQKLSVTGGEQDGSAFAGILSGMMPQPDPQPAVTGELTAAEFTAQINETTETTPPVAAAMTPETLAALVNPLAGKLAEKSGIIAMPTNQHDDSETFVEASAIPVLVEQTSGLANHISRMPVQKHSEDLGAKGFADMPENEQKPSNILTPQDVVMSATGAPAPAVPQTVGRKPETDRIDNNHINVTTVAAEIGVQPINQKIQSIPDVKIGVTKPAGSLAKVVSENPQTDNEPATKFGISDSSADIRSVANTPMQQIMAAYSLTGDYTSKAPLAVSRPQETLENEITIATPETVAGPMVIEVPLRQQTTASGTVKPVELAETVKPAIASPAAQLQSAPLSTVPQKEAQRPVGVSATPAISQTPQTQARETLSATAPVILPVENIVLQHTAAPSVVNAVEAVKAPAIAATPGVLEQTVQTAPAAAETLSVEATSTNAPTAATTPAVTQAPLLASLQNGPQPLATESAAASLQTVTKQVSAEKPALLHTAASVVAEPVPAVSAPAFMEAAHAAAPMVAEQTPAEAVTNKTAPAISVPAPVVVAQEARKMVETVSVPTETVAKPADTESASIIIPHNSADLSHVVASAQRQAPAEEVKSPAILQQTEQTAAPKFTESASPAKTEPVVEVPAKTELLAAKITSPAVPKMILQQAMEAYSRPFVTTAAKPEATRPAEQSPATGVMPPSQQIMTKLATPESAPETTQVTALPDQHYDAPPARLADSAASIIEKPATAGPEAGKSAPFSLPTAVVTNLEPQTVATASELTTASSAQHAIETGVLPAHTGVKIRDGREVAQEEHQQKSVPVTADAKSAVKAENVTHEAVKAVASAQAGEENHSGDNALADRAMNAPVHAMVQQPKPATDTAVAPLAIASNSTPEISEHVAKQISEHLAKHDIKTGTDQIVIRLTPENLGELRVNMKMENQRLSVEIVTENRQVRDSILQNSDTLRESLAKQNIKMDSFDVSTGSNGHDNLAGRNARNQSDWQELARNKQASQWLQGGYNIPKDIIPDKLAYNPHTELGMFNVHF
jgi:flagellar hook-length control protein FliK